MAHSYSAEAAMIAWQPMQGGCSQ